MYWTVSGLRIVGLYMVDISILFSLCVGIRMAFIWVGALFFVTRDGSVFSVYTMVSSFLM